MHDRFGKRWASVNLFETIETASDDLPIGADGRQTDGKILFLMFHLSVVLSVTE